MIDDPYASHVPFLKWIGQHVTPIRWVLELGAGRYSTPLWLDRSVFPDVERVVTVEHNKEWWPTLADPRLQMVQTNDVASFAESLLNVDPYDLIFIDNGSGPDGESGRVRTIKSVLNLLRMPLVVIHDWENVNYRLAAKGHNGWVLTDDARPQTALLVRRGKW